MHDSEHHLPKERTSDLYVLRLIAVSPKSQADTWSLKSRTASSMASGGDERMSGNAMERGA